MLTQNWNSSFNRIEISIGPTERCAIFILFEGTTAKKVRIDQASTTGALTLFAECSTCQTGLNFNVPIPVFLLPGSSYVITPMVGANCTAQINMPYDKHDETILTSPTMNVAATARIYSCHLSDRDNVHITIVIEDASGGGPTASKSSTTSSAQGTQGQSGSASGVGVALAPPPPPGHAP